MSKNASRTLGRVVVYPLVFLLVGGGLGFAAYPQVIGHKIWLISWAYRCIFHPPAYDAETVTRIARMRLVGWWQDVPGFRILDWREFGEEAREFLIEYVDDDGTTVQAVKRVWVRWKSWSQNNGEGVIYQGEGDRCQCQCFEVETVK